MRGFLLVATFLVALNTQAGEPQFTVNEALAEYPFSESVRVGDILFLSGQIGTLPDGNGLIDGGIGPETRQTMDNIGAALARHQLDFSDLVKCTVMMADIAEWPAMNEVYRTYFDGHYPARSAFAGSGLALDARVEIECIAAFSGE